MDVPNPGSDEAIEKGCECPVEDNGCGYGCSFGEGIYILSLFCPLHGFKAEEDEMGQENG